MNRKKQVLLFFTLIVCICAYIYIKGNDSLVTVSLIVLSTAGLTYIFNFLTKEYSWTDRLWSTLPIAIAWIYYFKNNNNALLLTAILISLWGIRLTFNFSRKGGYSDVEDYRWSYLRKKLSSKIIWQLFSLFFIAYYQQILFIGFTLPLSLISTSKVDINTYTILFSILSLVFLIIETIADQQQWVFQESKYGRRDKLDKLKKDYDQGFLSSGLFAISRHPNYFGELGFWYSIYFLCSSTINTFLNWTFIGPFMLSTLFVGSVMFTENITQSKYDGYGVYREQVSAVVPWFKRKKN